MSRGWRGSDKTSGSCWAGSRDRAGIESAKAGRAAPRARRAEFRRVFLQGKVPFCGGGIILYGSAVKASGREGRNPFFPVGVTIMYTKDKKR